MSKYLQENWMWIIPLVSWFLLSFTNAFTKYYKDKKGIAKFLLFVVEILSVFTSQKAACGNGPFKKLKLPGQVIPPTEKAIAPDKPSNVDSNPA